MELSCVCGRVHVCHRDGIRCYCSWQAKLKLWSFLQFKSRLWSKERQTIAFVVDKGLLGTLPVEYKAECHCVGYNYRLIMDAVRAQHFVSIISRDMTKWSVWALLFHCIFRTLHEMAHNCRYTKETLNINVHCIHICHSWIGNDTHIPGIDTKTTTLLYSGCSLQGARLIFICLVYVMLIRHLNW